MKKFREEKGTNTISLWFVLCPEKEYLYPHRSRLRSRVIATKHDHLLPATADIPLSIPDIFISRHLELVSLHMSPKRKELFLKSLIKKNTALLHSLQILFCEELKGLKRRHT